MLDEFVSNLKSFRHDRLSRVYILCNRLSLMSPDDLRRRLEESCGVSPEVVHDKERSVAGAWNRGIELATADGLSTFLITSVDVRVRDQAIDRLLAFEEARPDVALWSGSADRGPVPKDELDDACDFSCFMLRSRTIETHGWFDREFTPAYYEDNDYVTRVVLGGGTPKKLLHAKHDHAVSLTIRADLDAARHVRLRFPHNKERFLQKWGAKTDSYSELCERCYSSPFQSGRILSWWPEQDREGYSPSGGIDE